MGAVFGILFAIVLIVLLVITGANFLLGLHPIFGYIALLGCVFFMGSRWEGNPDFPSERSENYKMNFIIFCNSFLNLNGAAIGILLLVISASFFLIGFHHFEWCFNPPDGINCR